VDGTHRWRTSMKARAAVVGVTALSLALYGLLGGGAKSTVPFQGKSVSTVTTDKYAVAATADFHSTTGALNVNAVAMGPNHSLYFYWQTGGTWYGPLQVGSAGTAYSSPALESETHVNDSTNLDVAVEGPSHTLLFFWEIGTTWYGPLQIGAPGSTWSKPSVTVDTHGNLGNVDVFAQGPNGSLYQYWAISGAWNGPLQVAGAGTTLSAPAAHVGFDDDCSTGGPPIEGDSCVGVTALGPAHQNIAYWSLNGAWTAPSTSGQNQQYSSPSFAQIESGPVWATTYQGPGNSLIQQASTFNGGSNAYCVVAGAGSTYGAPSETGLDQGVNISLPPNPTLSTDIAAAGPSGSLYAYWFDSVAPSNPTACPAFTGPFQLSGAGTIHSVATTAETFDSVPNQVVNLLAEGPSNTLWVFWTANGTWYGPLQVGGPGTTFDSAN
jgi:hypothetical protein